MNSPSPNRLGRAAFGALLLGMLLVATPGCLVVPIPTNRLAEHSRRDITPEAMDALVVGQTSREEVLLNLGEPDYWSVDSHQYRYHWERIKWDILWIIAGGYSAEGGDIPVNKNHNLVLNFDAAGIISAKDFRTKYEESEQEKGLPRGQGVERLRFSTEPGGAALAANPAGLADAHGEQELDVASSLLQFVEHQFHRFYRWYTGERTTQDHDLVVLVGVVQ